MLNHVLVRYLKTLFCYVMLNPYAGGGMRLRQKQIYTSQVF